MLKDIINAMYASEFVISKYCTLNKKKVYQKRLVKLKRRIMIEIYFKFKS